MTFGRFSLDDAAGAVLAHTLRLPGGTTLGKGRVLTRDDLAALRAAGHDGVVAARFDEGDVAEDAAAAAVAETVAGPGVSTGRATTGRVNLHAAARGVAVVAAGAVDAVNAVDESVTLATVAPHALAAAGEIVATVKVIPFAAPGDVVRACVAAARAAGPIVSVAPLVPRPVGVVLTDLPGQPAAVLERAARHLEARVTALGSHVRRTVRCDHAEAAVAAALAALREDGARLLLVFGACATTDRRDVVPAAVTRAGGTVVHFGMPVDPGNLLLVARLGDVPVVGAPGCARSPRPSGFDVVLRRVLADLPVTRTEIMSLGVGGLLQEIGDRPRPRRDGGGEEDGGGGGEGRDGPPGLRVAAVVLAAGRSTRMGGDNKLLVAIDGVPMVARVVDAVREAGVGPIVVVTGHEVERVRGALTGRDVRFVHNPAHAEGLSASLRAGLAALGPDVDGALVCLGDMPWVRRAHVEALVAAFDPRAPGRGVCVPYHHGKRGNPVLWAKRYFRDMMQLTGDAGARGMLEDHAADVCAVAIEDPGVLLDVDTREALRALAEGRDVAEG